MKRKSGDAGLKVRINITRIRGRGSSRINGLKNFQDWNIMKRKKRCTAAYVQDTEPELTPIPLSSLVAQLSGNRPYSLIGFQQVTKLVLLLMLLYVANTLSM